jgi:LysW-gamma-L-lysine carboxypeptidase
MPLSGLTDEFSRYATLFGLVERFSPSGQESQAVEWLVARMGLLGYQETFTDPSGSAVGVLGGGPRQIVLLGHIDTVAGEIPPRLESEQLYGRGSVDAKGPLAAFVDAAANCGPQPGWQLIVIGAVDEERDSLGARHAAKTYQPDFAIIGEPSHWQRITLGYKGSAWARITVRRKQAHSAGQEESACEAAVRLWGAIQEQAAAFNRGRPKAFDQLLPNLRGLSSGEGGFEAWASLRLGVRLPLGFTPEAWYDRLREIATEDVVEPLGYPIAAYQGEKNTPLVRAFLAGIRLGGGTPGFVLKTGTADLNIVAPAWGCPAVAYGPGDSSLDHTPDEHISLAEYDRAVEVLQHVLRRLCETPGTLALDGSARR